MKRNYLLEIASNPNEVIKAIKLLESVNIEQVIKDLLYSQIDYTSPTAEVMAKFLYAEQAGILKALDALFEMPDRIEKLLADLSVGEGNSVSTREMENLGYDGEQIKRAAKEHSDEFPGS